MEKIKTTSVNKRKEMQQFPLMKGVVTKPLFVQLEMMAEKYSMTMQKKKKVGMGQPCLRPLLSLTRIEKAGSSLLSVTH